MSTDIALSVVVPVFNEEESIAPFLQRALPILERLDPRFEVIFVNDGSRDKTESIIKGFHLEDPRVKLVSFSRNFGKEIALTAGIESSSGEAVIPIDVDLQDPPELIPTLLEKLNSGFDVVFATRRVREGESWLKKLTANLFYQLMSSLSSFEIPKNTGDFRVMNRKVILALKRIGETNRFMKGLFSWVGFRQTSVLYDRERRFAGKTKWNYPKLINLAIEGVTSFSVKPLRIASFLGIFISVGALIYGVWIVISTLLFGTNVSGYPSLLTFVLFLGGAQLLGLGVLGEYVGRIYGEVKRRPLYLVQESLGFTDAS